MLERGSDMVLAAHRTSVGWGMVATTIETVRFEGPETVAFRLLRGPVPHVVERFTLHADAGATRLDYLGELGTELLAARPLVGGPGGPQVGSDRVGFPRPRPRRSRTKNGNRPQGPERATTPGVARA